MYTSPRMRRFDVTIEGAKVLEEYGVPAGEAEELEFFLPVTDGSVNVAFVRGSAGDPMVNAISVSCRFQGGLNHLCKLLCAVRALKDELILRRLNV